MSKTTVTTHELHRWDAENQKWVPEEKSITTVEEDTNPHGHVWNPQPQPSPWYYGPPRYGTGADTWPTVGGAERMRTTFQSSYDGKGEM